jgi:hypothetical protein
MKKYFFYLFILFIFTNCSGVKVTTDYDPKVEFNQYKTFSFMPWSKQSSEILSEYDKKRFRAAATYELEKIGYKKTEGPGDLAINILIIIDQKSGTSSYNDYYSSGVGVGYYYGPWGSNYPGGVSAYTTMHSYDYQEGTMILDILDVKKKQLAWQGIAKKTLNSNAKGDGSVIKQVMAKLFKDFPLKSN